MPEFLHLSPPSDALGIFLRTLPDRKLPAEMIATSSSLGRILAEDLCAPHALPEFTRSTVDGYAVQARATFGASESLPGYLPLVGEVPMGAAPDFDVPPGACALIHTGGMLPPGTDAVIMLEYSQQVQAHTGGSPSARTDSAVLVEFSRAVAEGENVLRIGEDVSAGQIVLWKGTSLRPAEIGGCMALGITKLRVAGKPRIGILSTGDEVIAPQVQPRPGQVRDINSYSLAALVAQAGGEPVRYGIFPDSLEKIKISAARALEECDAIVITAGSSASARDNTVQVIASLGPPGVLVHGINIRPGKPTILAVCAGKAVIGLPGNPVSALVIAGLFLVPAIKKMLGAQNRPASVIRAKLTSNIPSQAGREDWVAVRLLLPGETKDTHGSVEYFADPIFGKSNLIFSLAAADGLVCIPADATGLSAGEIVEVSAKP